MTSSINSIRTKYLRIHRSLDEKTRRLWCATEALSIKKHGVTLVHRATKVSRSVIHRGIKDLHQKGRRKKIKGRVRRKGGGTKAVSRKMPEIFVALETLVEAATKGDPELPMRWTNKGLRKLSEKPRKQGSVALKFMSFAKMTQAEPTESCIQWNLGTLWRFFMPSRKNRRAALQPHNKR